ncbi:MAG: hypothetical protein FJY54_03775 [Betaproteobacteria bacterium]|nr:hypothetical protein [Betaproteobacteria bacterium]
MTRRSREQAREPARPIRTKRDYERAAAVARKISGKAGRTPDAESRLQSLLREMDKFDQPEADADTDVPEDFDYAGPRRRWSDD